LQMETHEPIVNTREILTRPGPPADYRLAYGQLSEQFGDLRIPEGAGPFPVVVVIHGGCWRAIHTLEYMGHLSADLTAAGVATWNIEYRRLGQEGGGWPGTYLDVARAIDHLRDLATRFPLDLERVMVTGHSAGGHLALWAAGRRRLPEGSELYLSDPLPLVGAVPLAGLTDLRLTGTACDDELPRMYGADDTINQTSPIAMLPLGLPVVIIQGGEDEPVPPRQATTYLEVAEQSGDCPRLCLLPEADHFVIVDPRSSVWSRIRTEILSLLPDLHRQAG
jgi:acetyl esterase/lipase